VHFTIEPNTSMAFVTLRAILTVASTLGLTGAVESTSLLQSHKFKATSSSLSKTKLAKLTEEALSLVNSNDQALLQRASPLLKLLPHRPPSERLALLQALRASPHWRQLPATMRSSLAQLEVAQDSQLKDAVAMVDKVLSAKDKKPKNSKLNCTDPVDVITDCAIVAGGVVQCWGEDWEKVVPWDVKLEVAKSISSYRGDYCVILSEGGVRCWDTWGQWDFKSALSAPADLGTAEAITVADHYACALIVGGSVRCWGENGPTGGDLAVPTDLEEVQTISCGVTVCCALLAAGSVRCWGQHAPDQTGGSALDIPADLGAVQAVSAGGWHACALLAEGAVRCWGSNFLGQTDVPADLGPAQAIVANWKGTCALQVDGGVRCWGQAPGSAVPQPANFTATKISLESGQVCAIGTEGGVRCWGNTAGACEALPWIDDGEESERFEFPAEISKKGQTFTLQGGRCRSDSDFEDIDFHVACGKICQEGCGDSAVELPWPSTDEGPLEKMVCKRFGDAFRDENSEFNFVRGITAKETCKELCEMDDSCKYFAWEDNVCKRFPLRRYTRKSLEACAGHCARDESCVAFQWDEKECQLRAEASADLSSRESTGAFNACYFKR
jgi:hypothetical protein